MAVAEGGGDDELPLATNLHALKTLIPALDNLHICTSAFKCMLVQMYALEMYHSIKVLSTCTYVATLIVHTIKAHACSMHTYTNVCAC
jgi:hypothetical protein